MSSPTPALHADPPLRGGWTRHGGAFCLATLLYVASLAVAHAQTRHPFAIGATESGAPGGALGLWLMNEQARFTHAMSTALRSLHDDPTAFWTLAGLSFAYGVFHAAGPGHGKAVMASYMIANERALSRGLVLTAGAALLQAAVAIGLVAIARLVIGATAMRMTDAALAMETASYGIVAALGAWLVWRKGRAFATTLAAAWRHAPTLTFATTGGAAGRFTCEAVEAGHVHDACCGHAHAPDPTTLGDTFSWRAGMAALAAAGARPCSGAIVVLVFALAQDVFWAGIAATLFMAAGTALTTGALATTAVFAKRLAVKLVGADSSRAVLVARGAEFAAALFVLVVGLALLAGSAVAQMMA